MEKSNNRVLNELLVNLFHNVMDAEAKAVITDEFKDITNNDMHILEAIGIEEPKSMSRIAGELHVTVGTLTTNMNSLERKGYLTRNRSTRDKRVVLVTLTEKGRKAFFHHRRLMDTALFPIHQNVLRTDRQRLGSQMQNICIAHKIRHIAGPGLIVYLIRSPQLLQYRLLSDCRQSSLTGRNFVYSLKRDQFL